MATSENNNKPTEIKDEIARVIARYVPISTAVLGGVGLLLVFVFIYKGDYENAVDTLQYIFTALLPLWGTWLGTVLAFYFSKQNFEAANQSVKTLVETLSPKEKLESQKVTEVMMKFADLKCDNLKSTEQTGTIKIVEIRDKIIKANIKRWPIFQEGVFKYIFHKSTLEEYITHELIQGGKKKADVDKLTIADMIQGGTDWVKRVLVGGAGFVSEDATLYDAKKEMEKDDVRNDVFVTKSGKADEKVLGWISNVDIAKHGKY